MFISEQISGQISPISRKMKIHPVNVTEESNVVSTMILVDSYPSLSIFFAII